MDRWGSLRFVYGKNFYWSQTVFEEIAQYNYCTNSVIVVTKHMWLTFEISLWMHGSLGP